MPFFIRLKKISNEAHHIMLTAFFSTAPVADAAYIFARRFAEMLRAMYPLATDRELVVMHG